MAVQMMPYYPIVDEKVNILLVDDEPGNLLALEKVLAPLNENLVPASSGKAALKEVLKRDFALILLDVKMPGIDGYEAAQLIRQRDGSKKTPIIFVTGFDRDDVGVFKGYELGAVDYLVKPIQPKILVSKARVFVDLHKKTVELERQKEIAIAELRKNRELNKTNQLLERLKIEAEQFASIASHDLQTPLRHIANYVEIMRSECGDAVNDTQKEALDIISAGTTRMKALINDLLSLSRIGPQAMEIKSVDLNILVKSVLQVLGDEIDELGAEVVLDRLPIVRADESKIRQVFQNLIGNSLKYHDRNRQLKIEIFGTTTLGGHNVCVKDNGIGIRKDHFQRVFETFQRLHGHDEYSGTGIGLAICKKIVGLHNGEIRVDSTFGEGSAFSFQLPLNLKIEEVV